jgi:hypothetical protein
VSTAFAGLLFVGCVFGFLAGADILSGAALAIFIFGALVVFVPWAVWRLDPEMLAEEPRYRDGESGGKT